LRCYGLRTHDPQPASWCLFRDDAPSLHHQRKMVMPGFMPGILYSA
jgi:hypothetical protein